jgi:hypothetical protein
LGVGHKAIERVYVANDRARRVYVEAEEKKILYGAHDEWNDLEADEVDLRGQPVSDHAKKPTNQQKEWEQWGGCVERGYPRTLKLNRLAPKKTKMRAPGPGAIRMRDWEPFATKNLKKRKVILHSDGAQTYHLKVEGMKHDHVVHKRKVLKNAQGKPVKKDGKNVYLKPTHVKLYKHKCEFADGNKRLVLCKGGTQVIDRF